MATKKVSTSKHPEVIYFVNDVDDCPYHSMTDIEVDFYDSTQLTIIKYQLVEEGEYKIKSVLEKI